MIPTRGMFSGAKVLHFFELRKFLSKKMHFLHKTTKNNHKIETENTKIINEKTIYL